MRIGWMNMGYNTNLNGKLNTTDFNTINNYGGNPANTADADYAETVEMVANSNGTSFWLFFGGPCEQAASDESFGVGMIEIWVK
jgi:hypothetical protein